MAMDARAFGAYKERTERVTAVVRAADLVFVGTCVLLTASVVLGLSLAGLRAPFALFS